MRVLLDTTYARRAPYSGTAVYLDRLTDALAQNHDVEVIKVHNRRRRPPAGGGVGSVGNALADQWWAEIELPRLATGAGADLIHHPLPAHSHRAAVPQVVTVHDLAFERLPDHFDRAYRTFGHHRHRAAARRAAAVICVSETTARDVSELWGVPAERIVIAAHGPGQELATATPPTAEAQYFLYVGDDEPRKNLATLLTAYHRYRRQIAQPQPQALVVAGTPGRAPAPPGVRYEAHPSSQRLAQLYAGATALVHPALYEGFGMTTLEAMRLGTPVIAAATPALTEVCGDAARYVDPRDATALAGALAELAANENLRTELAARGQRRAAAYSWVSSARCHLDAYSLAGSR